MIRSMTGFVSKTITLPLTATNKVSLVISIKSLNSRFFELTAKLPYQLSNLETALAKILQNKLIRGHIFYTIHVDNQEFFQGSIEPSLSTIEGYIKAITRVKHHFNLEGSITIADLLQLPNIFNIEEKEIDEAAKQALLSATERLADELITVQAQEGATLKKDLDQRVSFMQHEIEAIEHASNELMDQQKSKISDTLKEVDLDENRLVDLQKSAAYLLLDKMDIHEEIVRFKVHVKSLSAQLESPSVEKGKRLDFTLQELAREINTIAAKCSDAAIGTSAINIKVELEKAREQAQNIV